MPPWLLENHSSTGLPSSLGAHKSDFTQLGNRLNWVVILLVSTDPMQELSRREGCARAAENWTRGTRWVWTKHIWSDKRKVQFMFLFILVKFSLKSKGLQIHIEYIIQQFRQTVQKMGQTVLMIGQNMRQSNMLSLLMVNLSNIADGYQFQV